MIGEIIHNILMYLTSLGEWGIMIGLMIEVIPSEIVLSYGGYLVAIGEVSFLSAVIFGVIGGTVAQIFVYWIGRYGGRPFLEKYGKYILIHKKHIDVAEDWFNKYGTGVIFTARFIPVVRHAISIPAGIAKMSLLRFTVLTTLAVIPWTIFFVYLGFTLGEEWENIEEKAAPFILPFILGAIGLTALYFVYKWYKKNKKSPAQSSNEGWGLTGDRAVSHELKFIGRKYKVSHRQLVRVGKSEQMFDHLIVGPSGIFYVMTNNWSGPLDFRHQRSDSDGQGTELEAVDRESGQPQIRPLLDQMYRLEYVLKEKLRQHNLKVDVVGVICCTHPKAEIVGQNSMVTALKTSQLNRFVKSYRPKVTLRNDQVQALLKILES